MSQKPSEFTIKYAKLINSLSFSRNHFGSIIFFANFLWIHLFLEITMNFTIWSAKSLWLHCQLRECAIDPLSFSPIHSLLTIHYGFTIFFANSHGTIIFFAKKVTIHNLCLEWTINWLSITQIHYDFIITLNSLLITRIKYSLSFSRNNCEFTIDPLFSSQISYEFTLPFASRLGFHYKFLKLTINSLSVTWYQYRFIIFVAN